MQQEDLTTLASHNPSLADAIANVAIDVPLEKIYAPIEEKFDAPAYKRYLSLCADMQVTTPPHLLVVEDETYKERYKANGARYFVESNAILLQENLWRAFSQFRAEGKYALTHELGHAYEHQHNAKPSRRTVLQGMLGTVMASPLPLVAGSVAGMQIVKTTTDDDSISNPNIIAGAIAGAAIASRITGKATKTLKRKEAASNLRASELFVDKLAVERLGHEEVVQGLLDFCLSDTKRIYAAELHFKSKEDLTKYNQLATGLCKRYPVLSHSQAQKILYLQALNADYKNETGYPSSYERIMEVLEDSNQSRNASKSR